MIYLNNFKLLTDLEEFDILKSKQINMHSTTYPFGIFPKKEMKSIKFDPITISLKNIVKSLCYNKIIKRYYYEEKINII